MSRELFLERVRQAANAGRAYRVHLHPIPQAAGYVGAAGDLCEKFAAEVDAVGGKAFLADNLAAARTLVERMLDEFPAASALVWQHELLGRLELDEMLARHNIQRHDYVTLAALPRDLRRAAAMECQIGITSCDWGIAETGTLVMCARTGRERIASLLPPVHVAIVEVEQLVPDLFDAIGLLGRRGALPSNVTLITGPSKTGDIELQLTTGVHGPGTWRVIVIRSTGDR